MIQKSIGIILSFAILQLASAFITASGSHRNGFSAKCNTPHFAAAIDADDDNGIAIALTDEVGQNDEILQALKSHPTLGMLGLELSFLEVPCIKESPDLFDSSLMEETDIACFGSSDTVKAWIKNVDKNLGKEMRSNGGVVAVCFSRDVANVCLQSQRWDSPNIYYPRGDEGSLEGWVDSGVQALGDMMERKFWAE